MCDGKLNYKFFDRLSEEDLESLLSQDVNCTKSDGLDEDAVLYITDLLAKKTDVSFENAKQSFIENYKPVLSDSTCLYDIDELGSGEKLPLSKAKTFRGIIRAAAVMLTLTGIIFICGATAYAFNIDISKLIPIWDSDKFMLISGVHNAESAELAGLRTLLTENDLPKALAPRYLPDGYHESGTGSDSYGHTRSIYGKYVSDSGSSILIKITKLDERWEFSPRYSKDAGEPEILSLKNADFYIMTDRGKYFAVWAFEGIHCSITGADDREELIKMILSIDAVN